jgi:hypothetical protein
VLLSTGTIKLAFITQNNHVYEYTAEGLTPEMSLNVRSPYRRQKRDLLIIRLSFRRPYTRIEIPAINTIIFFPTISIIFYLSTFSRSHQLFLIFLSSCDYIDYFLISYLPTSLRSYRLPNNLYSLSQSKPRWIYHV